MNWQALVSFRIMWAAFLAFILAILGVSDESEVGNWIIGIPSMLVGFGVYIGSAFSGEVLYCPACSKRVKLGANRCHHCGQNV
jgi:hypothetical protein